VDVVFASAEAFVEAFDGAFAAVAGVEAPNPLKHSAAKHTAAINKTIFFK
jgi:hypothetical protein